MARYDYLALARAALTEMLDEHHAVVWPEVEARASDERWRDHPVPLDPHWMTTARRELRVEGVTDEQHSLTRGGRRITTLVPGVVPRGRGRLVERAAARKRLLHTRYMGWASGGPGSRGYSARGARAWSIRR